MIYRLNRGRKVIGKYRSPQEAAEAVGFSDVHIRRVMASGAWTKRGYFTRKPESFEPRPDLPIGPTKRCEVLFADGRNRVYASIKEAGKALGYKGNTISAYLHYRQPDGRGWVEIPKGRAIRLL